MNLRRLLDDDDPVPVWYARGQRVEQRRLAGTGPAGDQDVLLPTNGGGKLRRDGRRQGTDVDEVVQVVAARELANRERRSSDGTWREHRRHTGAVLESCIEQRLDLGDFVAARACDVLDGDGEVPRFQ